MTQISNQAGSSRIGTAVTLFFFLFVALLAFAVGTFVGKSMSDSEYREAALERGDFKDFRSPASVEADEAAAAESLKPEEIEELKQAFIKAQEAEQESDSADRETASVKTEDGYTKVGSAGKKTPAQVGSAAARVAEGKAPAADVVPKRMPSSVLPTIAQSTIGKFTVQIASYSTEKEAEAHSREMKSKGYSAFYIPATVNNQTWYRVSIGLFNDQKSATSYRRQLMQEAKIDTAIIQKIVQ